MKTVNRILQQDLKTGLWSIDDRDVYQIAHLFRHTHNDINIVMQRLLNGEILKTEYCAFHVIAA